MRWLSEIKTYETNPRLNDDAINAVANSIKAFGTATCRKDFDERLR